jgi:hypothetical protein
VIVVRAWRDSQRVIIRVLAGIGQNGSTDEWVFANIDVACEQIANVLCELAEGQSPTAVPGDSESRIQSVDVQTHPDRRE